MAFTSVDIDFLCYISQVLFLLAGHELGIRLRLVTRGTSVSKTQILFKQVCFIYRRSRSKCNRLPFMFVTVYFVICPRLPVLSELTSK